jgi:heme o synthase
MYSRSIRLLQRQYHVLVRNSRFKSTATKSAIANDSIGRDYVKCYKELSKPVLSGLVVLSTSAGFLMSGSPAAFVPLLAVSVGTTLQAFSANSYNQIWEVKNDALMNRTKRRPLPTGRISRGHAAVWATACGAAGTGILLAGTNPLTAGLGLLNIGLYALVYTPLKTRTIANTWIGSVVGALPPMMGWTAATGTLMAPEPMLLGATLFFWQFPHFFALSWRSRNDYAAGGYKMLPVVDSKCGLRTARAILRHTMYLSSIPIVASLTGITSSMFAIESLAFNSYIIYLATQFHKKRSNRNAQQVFRSSLWYLPLTLSLMVYHSKNWSDKEDGDEETSIDRFVDNMRERLTDLCPHELFSRGDIVVDAGSVCPPTMITGADPLRNTSSSSSSSSDASLEIDVKDEK